MQNVLESQTFNKLSSVKNRYTYTQSYPALVIHHITLKLISDPLCISINLQLDRCCLFSNLCVCQHTSDDEAQANRV